MVRARLTRAALATLLGLACGCSSSPSLCSSCPGSSFSSRLTSLFRHGGCSGEVVGAPMEGPVIADPGPPPGEAPGFAPLPQSFAPPLAPPPRPLTNEAQRMPYQP
jgi:hypothetical protein